MCNKKVTTPGLGKVLLNIFNLGKLLLFVEHSFYSPLIFIVLTLEALFKELFELRVSWE